MSSRAQKLHSEINQAISRCRGVYSLWSKEHAVNYNTMLVFYTIQEQGFCTQKQLCNHYLLPPQTINHVIAGLRDRGLLCLSPEHSQGKEKAFILTKEGSVYSRELLTSLNKVEEQTMKIMGEEKLTALNQLLLEYAQTMHASLHDDD